MVEPGHLPPVPHHLSSRSPGRSAAYPPPLPTRKPHQQQPQPQQQQQAAASFHPPPSSSYPQQPHSEIQPALVTAEEPSHKAIKYKKPWVSGGENVGINVEPYESEANQNQMEDSDFDDDSFSSSSRSSLVSNAPSVQHFNISFIFKKTFREHEGARAFHSVRSILKVVYICSLRWTYNILLFTLGIMIAFLWAVINGAIAFLQAWILSPLTRVSLVVVKGVLPLILDPLSLILKACAEGCGGGGCTCAGLSAAFQPQGGFQRGVAAFQQKLEV